jgi:hypothetical protein
VDSDVIPNVIKNFFVRFVAFIAGVHLVTKWTNDQIHVASAKLLNQDYVLLPKLNCLQILINTFSLLGGCIF